jgi:sRNA-binding carbon storage regulator CsrA
MLYLTMREGDYALVGSDIKVVFSRAHGCNQIMLGFDAPKDVPVVRGQVYEQAMADRALTGDPEALALHSQLRQEREARQQKYSRRQAHRQTQARYREAATLQ